MKTLLLVCLLALVLADKWALIAAGSEGWGNYRHQAGASHAYTMLTTKGGFPKDHVIIMMEDDIAFCEENPFPGNLIHEPNGPNVYPGKGKVDYTGEQVTAANFLAILRGDKEAMRGVGSGKVIESTSNDEVLIYYVNHGGRHIVAFPHGGYLYGDELVKTIKDMKEAHKYKRILFYLSACESGSMMEGIMPENITAIVMTATNPHESGWACYYDDKRKAYLASEFDAQWTHFSDQADFKKDTVHKQYDWCTTKVLQSHPQIYGDKSHLYETVLGTWESYKQKDVHTEISAPKITDRISEWDVVEEQYKRAWTEGRISMDQYYTFKSEQLRNQYLHTQLIKKLYPAGVPFSSQMLDFPCYKAAIEGVEAICGKTPAESLKNLGGLADLCNAGVAAETIINTARGLC